MLAKVERRTRLGEQFVREWVLAAMDDLEQLYIYPTHAPGVSFKAELKGIIKEQTRNWIASLPNPDEPFVASSVRALTPRQILKEVEDETKWGLDFIKVWLKHGIQHIRLASVTDGLDSPAGS